MTKNITLKNYFIVLMLLASMSACNNEKNKTESTSLSDKNSQQITEKKTHYPYQDNDNIPASAYIENNEVYNHESVIPPQCYTKTEGVNNPCYACHQTYRHDKLRSNKMNDGSLQGEYEFSDLGVKNHWKNLFVDRRPLIKNISDEKINSWVEQDNYTAFINKQSNNTRWQGEHTPLKNLAYPEKAFDQQGLAKDGSHWVAFTYKPFPSTFWPTNGSTGDAMIRLPHAFREINGQYIEDLYFANLALVEMAMKDVQSISIPTISEVLIDKDLNGDGFISEKIDHIIRQNNYLGDANNIEIAHTLYPQGTEFLHTVRYIGVKEDGAIYNAPRLKEVRYMKKHQFKTSQNLASTYYAEQKEKNSESLPQVQQLGDKGINNNLGWTINGYIEDKKGELRHQNSQEIAFCGGCHKTIGSTLDHTFSFPRKVDGAKGWGYQNLATQKDVPNRGETKGEFLTYFERVGGGDEFRQNSEMLARWFNSDGSVNYEKVEKAKNLYELITPSARRARDLNKAYLTIVQEQSFIFGRDATLIKAANVLQHIDEDIAPLAEAHRYQWDMRLDWQQ